MKKRRRQTKATTRARAASVSHIAALLREGVSASQLKRLARDRRAGVRVLVERERRRQARRAAERRRLEALLVYERGLWTAGVLRVAGVDEVGAGTLAGPVVAAAVILSPGASFDGIDDSKALSVRQRLDLAARIRGEAVAWALGSCSAAEIDRLNILQASREAMRRAVAALPVAPEHLLVDARVVPGTSLPQTAIIHGDALSQSIAAASIVAKVERDALMQRLSVAHPGYGFERHVGYGTAQHLAALAARGPCPEHRQSFAPVAQATHPSAALSDRKAAQLPLFGVSAALSPRA